MGDEKGDEFQGGIQSPLDSIDSVIDGDSEGEPDSTESTEFSHSITDGESESVTEARAGGEGEPAKGGENGEDSARADKRDDVSERAHAESEDSSILDDIKSEFGDESGLR